MPAEETLASLRVLLVVPNLHYNGTARQAALLAAGLARQGGTVRVCALGGPAPWVESLRQAGVEVDLLGWTRWLDLAPFLRLRRLLGSYRPDVIHVWGPLALRSLLAVGRPRHCRLVGSRILTAGRQPGWLDRGLLCGLEGVLALGATDAQRYRMLGIANVVESRPAADTDALLFTPAGTERLPSFPAGARLLLGIGPLESAKEFYHAIWTLDILHLIFDNLHLVLVGDGPERPRLEKLVTNSRQTSCVHFVGSCPDLRPLLQRCELVCAPGRGSSVLLDAMAAGRPVVAGHFPENSEIVRDGETGLLVEPGNMPDLTRGVRQLLGSQELRDRMGAAARRWTRQQVTVARLVEAGTQLYQGQKQAAVAAISA